MGAVTYMRKSEMVEALRENLKLERAMCLVLESVTKKPEERQYALANDISSLFYPDASLDLASWQNQHADLSRAEYHRTG